MTLSYSDPRTLQARLRELQSQKEAILAKSTPKREYRDNLMNKAQEVDAKLSEEIGEIEKDLADIGFEMGFLARGLGGRALTDVE